MRGSVRDFTSEDPSIIKSRFISLLDSVTEKEVLLLNEEYTNTKDKFSFFADFETSKSVLLERWTHYRWIRLELTNIAYMHASSNKIAVLEIDNQKKISDLTKKMPPAKYSIPPLTPEEEKNAFRRFQSRIVDPILDNESAFIPAVVDSIAEAIQEDYLNGVPIAASIRLVRHMMLQIVGTEHPTDPLSQYARDILGQISYAIDVNTPDEASILVLLQELQNTDAIPPKQRGVVEEVNRNLHITQDKLYDALPLFIDSILNAYIKYYGEELFTNNEDEIVDALVKIVRHAFWAGFDGDGNFNVTPEAMRNAIRLYRIRAAEKHGETLTKNVVSLCNAISIKLKMDILNRFPDFLNKLRICTDDKYILQRMDIFHSNVATRMITGDLQFLINLFKDKIESIKQEIPNASDEKEIIIKILESQLHSAQQLDQLSQFSNSDQGDIQKLQDIFEKYKKAVRDNTGSFEIQDDKGKLHNPTAYIIEYYKKLLVSHHDLLEAHPQLKKQARYFNIQLHCFGMTYGVGHIRQDSSVYASVWDTILEDLCNDSECKAFKLFTFMGGKKYSELDPKQRRELHKRLQEIGNFKPFNFSLHNFK